MRGYWLTLCRRYGANAHARRNVRAALKGQKPIAQGKAGRVREPGRRPGFAITIFLFGRAERVAITKTSIEAEIDRLNNQAIANQPTSSRTNITPSTVVPQPVFAGAVNRIGSVRRNSASKASTKSFASLRPRPVALRYNLMAAT